MPDPLICPSCGQDLNSPGMPPKAVIVACTKCGWVNMEYAQRFADYINSILPQKPPGRGDA